MDDVRIRPEDAAAAPPGPARRIVAVSVVMAAVVMDLLDTSVVNVALPTLRTDLHAGSAALQWLVAGYSLAFAVLLVTGGRLGDVYGYRRVFACGVTGFMAASAVCALATDAGVLVAARVLQGAAAALMVPQATSLIQLMYRPQERSKVMGLFGALAGLAAALGPLLGGVILRADLLGAGWRPIFLVNVPVGAAALVAARYLLPSGASTGPQRTDPRGTALVVLGLTLLVLPLVEGPAEHWPAWTYLCLAASLPVLGLLVLDQRARERRGVPGLVHVPLFRQRCFGIGLVLSLLAEAVMSGLMITLTLVLQEGLGLSAFTAALATLPMIAGMVLGVAVLAESLLPRLGRGVLPVGNAVLATGLAGAAWTLHRFGEGTGVWELTPWLVAIGTGLGLIMGPLFAITLQNVDAAHVGSASGVLESVEQLGGVLGVVSIGTVFLHRVDGGDGGDGFAGAFGWGVGAALALLVVSCAVGFALPRRLRTESEIPAGAL
ncbi:MFS transporter [Streptomyces sp. NPDC008150]|uniref:MFS transporter n=1 Tax=Streptomyces sp. NPDC008150 TaxID=3364816 RepID=UPI0036E6B7CD